MAMLSACLPVVAVITSLAAGPVTAALPSAPGTAHVVVLHGLARTDRSMEPLAERIAAAGYRVFNVNYPSRDLTPDELISALHQVLQACCIQASRIHFVTHSLGGILVRGYAAQHPDPRVSRVVMLSPPNRGSELVDTFGDSWLFRAVMGPTARQLGTAGDSFPNSLPPPGFELGVIAATGSINPVGSALIPGEDDGIVALCSMWIEGVTDMITVASSHALVMRSPEVADLVLGFLADGSFGDEPEGRIDAIKSACAATEDHQDPATP
jgi:triacylglycerol lipase